MFFRTIVPNGHGGGTTAREHVNNPAYSLEDAQRVADRTPGAYVEQSANGLAWERIAVDAPAEPTAPATPDAPLIPAGLTPAQHYGYRRTIAVIELLESHPGNAMAAHWAHTLRQALLRPTGGTIRAFLTDAHRNGDALSTFQATIHLDGADVARISNVWMPAPRRVDSARATFATLNGSRREYAGVSTLIAHEGLYVGFSAMDAETVGIVAYA